MGIEPEPEMDKVKIEGMKAGLSSIDIYEEITGEGVMPKIPPEWNQTHGFIEKQVDALFKKVGIKRA